MFRVAENLAVNFTDTISARMTNTPRSPLETAPSNPPNITGGDGCHSCHIVGAVDMGTGL
jgi:hypothetical protein